MIKYFLFCILLCGCTIPRGEIIKTDEGVIMKANKPSIIKYKDKDIEVEFDSKGQPLIALDIPDVKVN